MDNKTKNTARKIKDLMAEQKRADGSYGWSQADLAYKAGVSQQTLVNLLKHNKRPKDVTIEKIAEALGVYKEYLTGETNYKNYDSWLDMWSIYDLNAKQEDALFNMLEAWGYVLDDKEKDQGFIFVSCPDGTKKALCKWHLEFLLQYFFTSFDNIIMPLHLIPEDVLKVMNKDA